MVEMDQEAFDRLVLELIKAVLIELKKLGISYGSMPRLH